MMKKLGMKNGTSRQMTKQLTIGRRYIALEE